MRHATAVMSATRRRRSRSPLPATPSTSVAASAASGTSSGSSTLAGQGLERLNANERLVLRADQPSISSTAASRMLYAWSVDVPLVTPPAAGWHAAGLALPPGALGGGGGTYTVWLQRARQPPRLPRCGMLGRIGELAAARRLSLDLSVKGSRNANAVRALGTRMV